MLKIKEGIQNKQVYKQIKGIQKNTRKSLNEAFDLIGDEIKNKIIFDLDDKASKTGRLYRIRVGNSYILHRASAPGQPPATLFGNLKRSLKTNTSGFDSLSIKAGDEQKVKGKAYYAKWLEEGTVKMAPRPYMKAAIKDKELITADYFVQQLKRHLEYL